LFDLDARNAAECRRRIGRTWAKSLRKKGKFVILVNGSLTRQPLTAIFCRCAFAATPQRSQASAVAGSGRNSIGT
jgi:hypothetical protein